MYTENAETNDYLLLIALRSGHLKTRFYDLSTRLSQLLLSLPLARSLALSHFFCRRRRCRCRYFKVRLRHEAIDRN